MVDSFARANSNYGTPNPLDTALPLIIDTVSATGGELDVDMVVRNQSGSDYQAWEQDNVKQRLKPLLSDAGSVLIASTGQAIWNSKGVLNNDSITGYLIDQYKLETEGYLGQSLWKKAPKETNSLPFNQNTPIRGQTIYVYGQLDGDENNNEVYVFWQEAPFKDLLFLGGTRPAAAPEQTPALLGETNPLDHSAPFAAATQTI
jgi:hypothetical protein